MSQNWRGLLCLLVVIAAMPFARISITQATQPATQRLPAMQQIAIGNTARQLGGTDWSWSMFVMGNEEMLEQIECVTYLLHPTFAERVQRVCDRGAVPGKGFTLTRSGWGTFTVGVTIDFKDGRRQFLTHALRFTANVEGWGLVDADAVAPVTISVSDVELNRGHFVFIVTPQRRSDGSVQASSIEIHVKEDGSDLATRWSFELQLNDQPWIHLRQASYNKRRGPVRLSGASLRPAESLRLSDRTIPIRVLGYRRTMVVPLR